MMNRLAGVLRAPAMLWAAGACVLSLGCEGQERKTTFTTRDRSQAVQSTEAAVQGMAGAAAAPNRAPAAATAPRRRALCGGRLHEGKTLPQKRLTRVSAGDNSEVSDQLLPSKSGMTWVNFWAAWCAPCKEEIPRLNAWERKLSTGSTPFKLVFVSLDDDERQLRAFLAGQGELRTTYWLKEGSERDEWMIAAGLSPDPELPIHLLVDSQRKIRCVVQGAVEDSDFPELVRLLGE